MGPVGAAVQIACYAMLIAIFVRVAFSWIGSSNPERNSVYLIAYRLTEPLLRPVRNLLPGGGGMDFSPMVVSFGLFMVIGLARNL